MTDPRSYAERQADRLEQEAAALRRSAARYRARAARCEGLANGRLRTARALRRNRADEQQAS